MSANPPYVGTPLIIVNSLDNGKGQNWMRTNLGRRSRPQGEGVQTRNRFRTHLLQFLYHTLHLRLLALDKVSKSSSNPLVWPTKLVGRRER